jgi:uncharacterized protein (TIGR02466 family)
MPLENQGLFCGRSEVMGMAAIEGKEVALFPTRVWLFQPDEKLNTSLDRIQDLLLIWLAEEKLDPQSWRSARGCWRLENAHLKPELKEITEHLKIIIKKVCQACGISSDRREFGSWIDVMDTWGSHVCHHHAPNVLSGVFYIAKPEGAGNLILRDPRPARSWHEPSAQALEIPVEAAPGSTIVFPAWLEHYVEASAGNEGRIALSFNVGAELK